MSNFAIVSHKNDNNKNQNDIDNTKNGHNEIKSDNNEIKSDNNEIKSDNNEIKSDNNENKSDNNENKINTSDVYDSQQHSLEEELQLPKLQTFDHQQLSQKERNQTMVPRQEGVVDGDIMTHNYEYVCNIRMLQATGDGAVITAKAKEEDSRLVVVFGVMLRLVLPLANGVARSIKGIRDVSLLHTFQKIAASRQTLTNVIAFVVNSISLGLSSVQVSYRLELLSKLMKIRKTDDGPKSLSDTHKQSPPTSPTLTNSTLLRDLGGRTLPLLTPALEHLALKCCSLNVLATPPPGTPIRADIVFIHGLHGSQLNTWKQGLWKNERRPEEFERPPKLPLRPPKRPRHSRSTALRPPHKRKRARFHSTPQSSCERNDNDFNECPSCHNGVEHTDLQGLEFSFPTFRRCRNDNSRLLQADFDCVFSESPPSKVAPNAGANHGQDRRAMKDAQKTFTKSSANDPTYSRCWPRDWLPLDCPGVRVIAVNYTTDPYLWRPLWKKKEARTNLAQRAREMTELLIAERVGYGHPIIWVGHSKGGLYIKQIIVDAWESGRPATMPLWQSARGVFFYSVPHRGSHLASIKAPLLRRSVELIDIEKNSKYLIDLHRRFVCLYQLGYLKIEVFSFVETALTLMSVLFLRIVGVDSADPGIGDVCGIHLDHREICKPRSRECILYIELVKLINNVC